MPARSPTVGKKKNMKNPGKVPIQQKKKKKKISQ